MRDELLALAELDAALLQARHAADRPAGHEALEALDAELDELRAKKRAVDADRAPLLARAAALEQQAAAAGDRAAALESTARSATGGGRELGQMADEAASQRRRQGAFEDEQLEVLTELEPLEVLDAELRRRFEELRALREARFIEVDRERAAANAEAAALEARRPALLAALDPELQSRYERAARHAGGVGAAALVGERCGGCRVAVPSAVADRLVRGDDRELVVVCDECGRLLVR